MKKLLTAAAALAGGLALAGSVSAATVFNVTVWTGAPGGVTSSAIADNADTPSGTPTAQFTYSGPIDWVNLASQNNTPAGNLVKNFISASDQALISGFTSATYSNNLSSWLNSSLSVAGDSIVSYFKIVGTYTSGSPTSYTITHDDGASVYNSDGVAVYSSPAETSAVNGVFTLPAGTNSTFTVDYVEANGSPSILNVTAVPEPATWAMVIMGFGMLGAGLRLRRKSDEEAVLA